jgi:hypothetical protein
MSFLYTTLITLLLVISNVAASDETAQIPKSNIHSWMDFGERVVGDVLLDGKKVGTFDYKAIASNFSKEPMVSFNIPPKTEHLQLRGTFFEMSAIRKRVL